MEKTFAVYDVHIDPGGEPLAAWQAKIRAPKNVKIVSVEGGDHAAFLPPPYFDGKALKKNVIRLAAFSTREAERLPRERTRVASLHVEIEGNVAGAFQVELETAANHEAEKIKCTLEITKRERPTEQ